MKKTGFRLFKVRRLTIAAKFLILLLVLFFAILLASYGIYKIYCIDQENAAMQSFQQQNRKALEEIDSLMQGFLNTSKLPLLMEEGMQSELIEGWAEFNDTKTLTLSFQQQLAELARRMLTSSPNIHSVFLYNTTGESESYVAYDALLPTTANPAEEKWFRDCLAARGKPLIRGSFKREDIYSPKGESRYLFSVSRGILNIDVGEMIGLVSINCDIDVLREICKDMDTIPNQIVQIVDEEGLVIYDSDVNKIGKRTQQPFVSKIETEADSHGRVMIAEEEYIGCTAASSLTGWRIFNFVPAKQINQFIDTTRSMVYFSIFLSIAVVAGVSILFLSYQVATPIHKLVAEMKKVQYGDFNTTLEATGTDEIGMLTKAFNKMVGKMNVLVNEVYVNKIKHNELEMEMLQNQINPHFLYNTLESIHMMAEIKNETEISQMVRALGNLMRYNIRNPFETVRVSEEVSRLKDYILLQSVCFEDMFTVTVQVQQEILTCSMVKMILQPLLENAIQHGMKNTVTGGKITVKGGQEGDDIVFEVSDNGVGMDAETTDNLNAYLRGENTLWTGIGMRNVHKRLQLHYGEAYGLTVLRQKQQGTTIQARLPCVVESATV